MLVIRFSRVGKKNRAQFRIVAQERTAAPSGKHIEILGSYDPHFKKGVFKKERIEHWIENGAQVSDSVYNLLISHGIIKGKKRPIKITAKKEKGKKDEEGKKEEEKKTEETKSEEKKEKAEEAKPEKKEIKLEEKKGEMKEVKEGEEKISAAPDAAKPEKAEEVKKEEKKEEPEKKKEK
jgi:small subunit ribosomal protein S16